jgi:hypothetical protein
VLLVLVVTGFELLRRQVRHELPDAGVDEAPPAADDRAAPRDDALARLERLAALHRSGQLDDDEYSAAKQRVLTPA